MKKIFPSLISSDLLNIGSVIESLEPHCQGFHIDVMDYHFVPNLTWGIDFVNAIRKKATKQLQVHLMVDYPEKYIDRMQLHEGDIICIHFESPSSLSFAQLCQKIRSLRLIPSLTLSPFTPLDALIQALTPLEHVLLMSVNPGFSGQKFISYSIDKLIALNNFKKAHGLSFTIAIDGGITEEILPTLIQYGAEEFAIASTIFSAADPVKKLIELEHIINQEAHL